MQDTFYIKKYKEILYKHGLHQIITKPTRETANSSTIIDHVITRLKNLEWKVLKTPRISDHYIIFLSLPIKIENYEILIEKRNYKEYDKEAFQYMIRDGYEWNNSSANVNSLADAFINSLTETINHMCPIRRVRTHRNRITCEWMNVEIAQLMKLRDDKHKAARLTGSLNLWEEYKKLRNTVVGKIRKAKDEYFRKKIDVNKSKPAEMWKELKKMLPNKNETPQKIIQFGDKKVESTLQIAESFNSYFVKSVEDIVKDIKNQCDGKYEEIKIEKINNFNEFCTMDMLSFKQIVSSLKNCGGGEEGVTTSILKDVVDVVGNRLLDVVNTSLSKGIFPENWKISTVTPVPKIANTKRCEEFRPINIVPVYEKVLEVAVKKQLQDFCEKNSVINKHQSGFQKNHSCEAVMLEICDKWLCDLEEKKNVIVVFLDLRRAFETVNRVLLLKKMQAIGIGGNVLSWFDSYLSNRFQKVNFRGSYSKCLKVNNGVPQGTTLGPLLFLLYYNDVVNFVKHCHCKLFADDTCYLLVAQILKT
jgi:NADPH-dependent 7-cyano-7-deazaguanine reductase QueF